MMSVRRCVDIIDQMHENFLAKRIKLSCGVFLNKVTVKEAKNNLKNKVSSISH